VAFEKLLVEMNTLAKTLNSLFKGLTELVEVGVGDFESLVAQLNGHVRFMVTAGEQLNGIVSKPSDKMIYWADVELRRAGRARQPKLTLNAAPLHVGPLMKQHLWEGKDAVVMTSATMRTANSNNKAMPSFEYIKHRLDAQDASELAVGSPFDYKASTLLYLVTDVPEPNQQGYQQAVERGLIDLFKASGGRGLALFTSYTALRATARVIAPELQKSDILVYEQGDGTSRRVMIEQFRAAERAVMMGTKSFWEGVDIQGDRLSALAICKLPFDVPSDPIFAARSETFENSFNDYSVPETVLRFRQGFGRLIRSTSDRGVIVVFDRRLISKNYGTAFLNALPGPTIVRAPGSMLTKHVSEWLAKGGVR
jgi:ATP-dependent DNA helicase DinG